MDGSVRPPVVDRALQRDVAEGAAAVLRALADPLRLQIVAALATAPEGRMAAGEVAGLTALSAPTVSHHLRSLREAGVVVARRRGTWVFYALAPGMGRVASTVLDALAAAAPRPGDPGRPVPDEVPVDRAAAPDVDAVLAGATRRLAGRYPAVDGDLLVRTVRESYAGLGRTTEPTTLPARAERFAAQRLEDVLRASGRAGAPLRPQVLFVCVANAGRSQLAAALLRRHAGDAVVVRSAGSMPAPEVHAAVRPLLAELWPDGEDLPFPKPLTDDAVRAADVVVTMGCGDHCPVLPGKRYEDWAVGDPALASPAGVRAIRDDLDARVRVLADDLTRPPTVRPTTDTTLREIP